MFFYPVTPSSVTVSVGQVIKTYHMYHTESISAESKLKDAEKQEEKQFSKSGDLNVNLLRHDDRQPRRGFVRKIEKMKEKVRSSVGVHSPLVLVGMATRLMFMNIGSSEPNSLYMVGYVGFSGASGADSSVISGDPLNQIAGRQPCQHSANAQIRGQTRG